MAKVHWKGSTLLSPTPAVLVTCGSYENANIITVGWTGIICTRPPRLYISLRKSRYSYGLIKESGEFAVNLTTAGMLEAVDKCGVYTGKNKDKFRMCKLNKEPAQLINAPLIAESPVTLECRVFETVSLGSHDMFMADIVGVDADESLIDETGALCLERCGILAYSHGKYYSLVKPLSSLGFAVKKKVRRA